MFRTLHSVLFLVLCSSIVAAQPKEKKGSSPADSLKREKISKKELTDAGYGNPDKAPDELVAVRLAPGEKTGYYCVAFTPDGKNLMMGTEDGFIYQWDLRRNSMNSFKAHKGRVWDIKFGPKGKTYASAGSDGKVFVYSTSGSGKPLEFRSQGGARCTIAYDPEEKNLAMSCSGAKGVLCFKPLSQKKEVEMKGENFDASSTAVSPDGKFVVAGSWEGNEGRVRFWDAKTGAQDENRKLDDPGRPVHSMVFNPSGTILATAHDYRNFIQFWDPNTGQKGKTLNGHTSTVHQLAFSPKGDILASTSADRTLRLWDPETGKETKSITLGPKAGLGRLAFSPEGRHIAVVAANGSVYVLRLALPE